MTLGNKQIATHPGDIQLRNSAHPFCAVGRVKGTNEAEEANYKLKNLKLSQKAFVCVSHGPRMRF